MSANTLFDAVMKDNIVKNDAQLSRELKVAPPVISGMRSKRLTVGPAMILNIHETYGMRVNKIRALLAA